jgi:hypothetical protein
MACVNQTRPHCVNQMGKTHSNPLASRHGRGTAWARHAMCESAFSRKKRTVTQPVKKFTTFYGARWFIAVPYLTTANMKPLPMHTFPFYFFYFLVNIILQCILRSSEYFLSFEFTSNKNFVSISNLSQGCHMTHPTHLPLVHSSNNWLEILIANPHFM